MRWRCRSCPLAHRNSECVYAVVTNGSEGRKRFGVIGSDEAAILLRPTSFRSCPAKFGNHPGFSFQRTSVSHRVTRNSPSRGSPALLVAFLANRSPIESPKEWLFGQCNHSYIVEVGEEDWRRRFCATRSPFKIAKESSKVRLYRD